MKMEDLKEKHVFISSILITEIQFRKTNFKSKILYAGTINTFKNAKQYFKTDINLS